MKTYQHTQTGTLVLVVLGFGIALCSVILFLVPLTSERALVGGVVGVLLLCMYLFRTLNTAVDPQEIKVWFGPGWIRKRFQANEITDARIVRNSWYHGWGVRLIPNGWMFNVSGYDAVEIDISNNRKFRIGTDEPEQLLEAIVQACQLNPRNPGA